ncbi:MAG: uncharacterized protein KVP18_002966 [Porospora cf. gigantea A]|uniref:uncharacterized protein n=1 Tax=Porospora cf. gigantea A TaxID=2853593 RepID=UPI0035597F88|nr:MAG: hypothetical protein KVP18_002966 [Porospora cf. gigantea A]
MLFAGAFAKVKTSKSHSKVLWLQFDEHVLTMQANRGGTTLYAVNCIKVPLQLEALWGPDLPPEGTPRPANTMASICCCGMRQKLEKAAFDPVTLRLSCVGRAEWMNITLRHFEMLPFMERLQSFETEPEELPLAKNEDFWTKELMPWRDLLTEAGTGDVLVFKTPNLIPKLQRVVTGSTADHVGLLFRKEKAVWFMDSVGDGGVKAYELEDFFELGLHKMYETIVYRKLLHDPFSDEALEGFSNFLDESLGADYHLSVHSLVRSRSMDNMERKGYSCSELVAKSWKALGVIPPDKVTSTWLPKDFTQDEAIDFNTNCGLSREVRLVVT